jgi:hypothetical protein
LPQCYITFCSVDQSIDQSMKKVDPGWSQQLGGLFAVGVRVGRLIRLFLTFERHAEISKKNERQAI